MKSELGEKSNISKVHPHKFRRTLATNAIDKGIPRAGSKTTWPYAN